MRSGDQHGAGIGREEQRRASRRKRAARNGVSTGPSGGHAPPEAPSKGGYYSFGSEHGVNSALPGALR